MKTSAEPKARRNSEFCRCWKMREALSLAKCSFTRVENAGSFRKVLFSRKSSLVCCIQDPLGICITNILIFFISPSSPLFKSLQVIKLYDLVTFHIATFMYKFHNQLLPTAFHSFFTKVTNIHKYNTARLAAKQSYYLPFVRTNYGKFINTRFHGSSIWNCID